MAVVAYAEMYDIERRVCVQLAGVTFRRLDEVWRGHIHEVRVRLYSIE